MAKMTSLASSLPMFSGEKSECFEFFISSIEAIASLEKWSMDRKVLVLKLHLSGKALSYFNNHRAIDQNSTFDQIKKILEDKFQKKVDEEQISQKFNSLSQRVDQSVTDLIDEVSSTIEDYLNINQNSSEDVINIAERLKSQKFMDALRPEIRSDVIKTGAKNFKEMARHAVNIEKALNSLAGVCNNATTSTEIQFLIKSQIDNQKKINDLTNIVEGFQSKQVANAISVQNKPNETKKVTCHICGKNHITTKCWYYPTNFHPYRNNRGHFRGRGNFRGNSNNFRRNFRGNVRGNFNKQNPNLN